MDPSQRLANVYIIYNISQTSFSNWEIAAKTPPDPVPYAMICGRPKEQ